MRCWAVVNGMVAEVGTCDGPAAGLAAELATGLATDATGRSAAAEVGAATFFSAVAAGGAGKNVALFPL